MSKHEILQSNKLNQELGNMYEALDYNILLNSKIQNYNIFIDIFSRIVIDGSKVFIIIMFGL
jgi:hypothetical protein